MPVPDANTAWFTLKLNDRADFAVYSFFGSEAVCRPYEVTIELMSPSSREDIAASIGTPTLVRQYFPARRQSNGSSAVP